MSIIKNEIPILEFDTEQTAVINPTYEKLDLKLPKKCVSAFRGAAWGMILYTADSLADVDKYNERNWGCNAYEYALTLCLDAVQKL